MLACFYCRRPPCLLARSHSFPMIRLSRRYQFLLLVRYALNLAISLLFSLVGPGGDLLLEIPAKGSVTLNISSPQLLTEVTRADVHTDYYPAFF